MELMEAVATRSSVRTYTDEEISDTRLGHILEAGRLAPSGLNNQPWRFVVIRDAGMIEKMAGLTKYGAVVARAKLLVAVFIDNAAGYHRDKDMHGIGACVQNMWLAAHSLGVGMCWVGEILSRRDEVEQALGVSENHELMALLCFGRPAPDQPAKKDRKPLEELIIGRF